MDLVDDREHPFGVETELVLGVDEHQTRLGGDLLSPFEDLKRNGARLIPQLGVDDAMFDDLEFCDRFVVAALFGFGCGGDDRLGQWVVLLHPIGEVEPVDRAGTSVVLRPQRGRGRAGQSASHDDLDRQGVALLSDRDICIWNRYDVRRHKVGDLFEPPGSELVQHLTAIRNGAQDIVERRDAIGGDQGEGVAEIDDVAHLADDERSETRDDIGLDARERMSEAGTEIRRARATAHRAAATKASNNGRPEPPSGPDGRCQSRT